VKYFLLIAGENYYPSPGTEDWIATFETKEEARAEVELKSKASQKGLHGHWLGEWEIRGCHYHWYDIIDLREWVN